MKSLLKASVFALAGWLAYVGIDSVIDHPPNTAAFAQAGQPAAWNYAFDQNGKGNATYPGDVYVMGSIALPNNTGIAAGTGTFTQSLSVAGQNIAGAGLIGVQTFCVSGCTNTNGPYTPDPGTQAIIAIVVGGGGGSGGCPATGANQYCIAQSGTAAASAAVYYNGTLTGLTVTGGGFGGGGSAGGAGSNGSSSSISSVVTCAGGNGGAAGIVSGSSVPITVSATNVGASKCNVTAGTTIWNSAGLAGGYGMALSYTDVISMPGAPAAFLGIFPFAQATGSAIAGQNAAGYGSGAGGAASAQSQAAVGGKGGSSGIVIIYEYS